jgi:hypothetical protein
MLLVSIDAHLVMLMILMKKMMMMMMMMVIEEMGHPGPGRIGLGFSPVAELVAVKS